MRRAWLLVIAGCATQPPPPDTFSQRVREQCESARSCKDLLEEAQARRDTCKEREDCPRSYAIIKWLREQIQKHEIEERVQQELAEERKNREAEERESEQRNKARAQEADAAQKAREAERGRAYMAYLNAGARDCKETGEKPACMALMRFIRENPKHPFIENATEDLKIGYAKLESKLDEETWGNIDKKACKTPKTSSDCDDLQAHFHAFKNCKHKEEIATIVQGSAKRIEALRRIDAAKEAATAAREQAEAKAACRKVCAYHCSFAVHYGVCLNVCVEAQC